MEKIYRQGVRPDIPYDMRYAMAKPVGVPYSGLEHANAEHNAEVWELRGVVLVGEHRVSRRREKVNFPLRSVWRQLTFCLE